MPASPDDGAEYVADVLARVEELELYLLRLIASRLAGAREETWEADAYAALAQWRVAAQAGLAKAAPDLLDLVNDILLKARGNGAALAVADLDAIPGVTPALAAPATATVAAAEVLGAQVVGALQNAPRLLEPVYRQAVEAGAQEVLGGQVTRVQAAQHVLDRLGSQGVTGFRSRDGRNWSLSSYVEMAVRTEAGHQAVQGHVDQLQAAGVDLVVVSDSPRECPLCRPWEGKVLSVSGAVGAVIVPSAVEVGGSVRVDVAGSLDEARRAGFQHPNCTHNVRAYVPGATRLQTPKSDPGGYEAKQRQRAMERKIREWKRREALALDDAAAGQARAKVRTWQKELREHVDANDLKRLRRREQIGTAI